MIGFDLDGTLVNTDVANRRAYTRIGLGDKYRCGQSLREWSGITDEQKLQSVKLAKSLVYPEYLRDTTLTQTGLELRDNQMPLFIVTCASYANACAVLRFHRFKVRTVLCAPTRQRKIEIVNDLCLTEFVDDDPFVRNALRTSGISVICPVQ